LIAAICLASLSPGRPSLAEKLKGYIWDVKGSTVIVEGMDVRLLPSTRIERPNHPDITASDLRIGWEVEVEGESARKVLSARKLEVKTERFKELKVDGFVEEIEARTVGVDGRTLHWPQGFSQQVTPGMYLKGKGTRLEDGSIQLEELELKPAGLEKGELEFLSLAAQEISELKEKLVFYNDRLLHDYVNRVGRRLAPYWAENQRVQFSFYIVDDPDLNAFAMPDGTVVVHTGLVAVLENEAQLATVLGHEIAHVTHKHSYRGYRRAQKMQWLALGAAVAGAALEQSQGRDPWEGPSLGRVFLEVGATLALSAAINGHGRDQEDDADRIGLHYLLEAGYDPYQAPQVWYIFNEHIRDQAAVTNWLFSDHSTHRARISNLSREINLNYRGKIDASSLNRNPDVYSHRVRGARRHNAIADYRRKELDNAEVAFRRLIEEDPDDAVSHLYLGNIYRDTRGPSGVSRAIEEYETALRIDTHFPDPYREMGFLYYGQRDLPRPRSRRA
jgi:Zn-dependent protease with chaperone function